MPKEPARTAHWLLKSEPSTFSFDDLWRAKGRTTGWNGVRNYQARNFLRDMRVGDGVLYYHSGDEPGVAGIAQIAAVAYPDPTQFDPQDDGYDAASTRDEPRWYQVDVRAVEKLPRLVPLAELRADRALAGMELLRRGSRLSVQPVLVAHWDRVRALAQAR
ncbi:MAG: EVE domain-containing protein [Planctomycetota bacterium]|nr:MAG: EVE domain-containing protein [Planctomycetota bacterium]